MDHLDIMQTQNVRLWCNVCLALQNGTVLTYLPSINFIPPRVGVLNDHCQILIDIVQLSDKHNKSLQYV